MKFVMKIRHGNGVMNTKIKMRMDWLHSRFFGIMNKQPNIMVVRAQLQKNQTCNDSKITTILNFSKTPIIMKCLPIIVSKVLNSIRVSQNHKATKQEDVYGHTIAFPQSSEVLETINLKCKRKPNDLSQSTTT